MMNYTIPLFAALTVGEVLRHWYLIEWKHRSPDKLLSWLLRAGMCFGYAAIDSRPFLFVLLQGAIFNWFVHDYLLNWLRGVKPIWHLNDTGWIDKFQRTHPNAFAWFVWKAILFIGLTGAYFANY